MSNYPHSWSKRCIRERDGEEHKDHVKLLTFFSSSAMRSDLEGPLLNFRMILLNIVSRQTLARCYPTPWEFSSLFFLLTIIGIITMSPHPRFHTQSFITLNVQQQFISTQIDAKHNYKSNSHNLTPQPCSQALHIIKCKMLHWSITQPLV